MGFSFYPGYVQRFVSKGASSKHRCERSSGIGCQKWAPPNPFTLYTTEQFTFDWLFSFDFARISASEIVGPALTGNRRWCIPRTRSSRNHWLRPRIIPGMGYVVVRSDKLVWDSEVSTPLVSCCTCRNQYNFAFFPVNCISVRYNYFECLLLPLWFRSKLQSFLTCNFFLWFRLAKFLWFHWTIQVNSKKSRFPAVVMFLQPLYRNLFKCKSELKGNQL